MRLDRILYICIGCFFITIFVLFILGIIINSVPSLLNKPQQSNESNIGVQASQDLKDYAKEKEKETWTKFEKELDITIPENERENFYQTIKTVEEDDTISQKTKEEVLDHLIERYKN